MFTGASGFYVALVFAWFELKGLWSEEEEDPVVKTVRKNIEGAHWLIEVRHARKILQNVKPFSADEWRALLQRLGEREADFVRDFFEAALQFVLERLSELKDGEALLVSIG